MPFLNQVFEKELKHSIHASIGGFRRPFLLSVTLPFPLFGGRARQPLICSAPLLDLILLQSGMFFSTVNQVVKGILLFHDEIIVHRCRHPNL